MMAFITGRKEKLVEQLLHDPLQFEKNDGADELVNRKVTFGEIRACIKRVYDLNDEQLRKISNANSGPLGFMNKLSTKKRFKTFRKKVNSRKNDNAILIYAEGDSWFQYPIFLKEIIDYLNKKKDFIIYSEAFAGDWITNILYESQYVPSLSVYDPEVFLISGGGNDLVGDHRIGNMVNNPGNYRDKYRNIHEIKYPHVTDEEKAEILIVQKYIKKEFYALLQLFKLEYTLLFESIYADDSTKKDILIITQGYDCAIPSPKVRLNSFNLAQPFLNLMSKSGNWLYTPLKAKGIIDRKEQKAVVKFMINEFNEMLISLAVKYPNVYHVDNRGTAPEFKCWFDELHLHSKYYKKIAKSYEYIIRNYRNGDVPKVVRTADR